MKNKKTDVNEPIFKIKKPKIVYNAEQAKKDEKKLIDKLNNFRINRKFKYKRDFYGVKRKKVSEKKVKDEFVKQTFVSNPYYHIKAEQEFNKETGLFEDQHAKNLKKLEGKVLTSKNLEIAQEQLDYELTQNLFSKSGKSSVNGKENDELQGTRGLSKFDCWDEDLDPSEWIRLCREEEIASNAKCSYFKDGRYVWLDAKVLDYDKEKQRFLVEILKEDGNFRKYISRLSLYFKKESFAKFRKRIMQSKHFQQQATDKIVFYRYVESVDSDCISPMPISMINNIFKKVLNSKFRTKDLKANQAIASRMMQIIRAEYLREMKKYYVLEELKNPQKKEFFEQKKIKCETKTREKIEYDVILNIKTRKSFAEKLKMVRSKNFIRNEYMHEAIKLFQDKCFVHKKTILLDTNLLDKSAPFVLEDFMNIQSEFFQKNRDSLKIQWREYPLGDICDILRNVSFFMSSFNDINDYNSTSKNSLKKFIYRIDLSFKKHLEDFLTLNFKSWINFLQRFILSDESDNVNWVIQEKPLLQIEIVCNEVEKKKKDKKKEIQKNLIQFQPSPEELKEKLTQPIRWLVDFLNSLDNLEPDIIKVLGIAPKKIFDIKETDPIVDNVYKKIDGYLQRALEEPFKILEEFKQFNFLLEKPKEEIIKTYTDNLKKKKSVKNIEKYLNKINESINGINNLYCNNHNTVFFQILSQKSKEVLINRAKDIKKGFLKKIGGSIVKSINTIKGKYKKMQDDLVKTPEKEEDLIVLNENIENCDKDLEQQEQEIESTYEYILLMEQYGEQLDYDLMIKFWLLKVSPLEVRMAYNEGKKIASYNEQAFLHKLEEDKKEFENNISLYKIEFDRLKNFADYSKVTECAKQNEALGKNLDRAKVILEDFHRREKIFNITESAYENLEKLAEEFSPYREMWDVGFRFDLSKDSWLVTPLIKLTFKKVTGDLDKYKKKAKSLMRKFEEEGNENAVKVCTQLKEEVQKFEIHLTLIENLTKECMTKKPNNWKNLFAKLKMKTNQQQETLQSLLSLQVDRKVEEIEEFVNTAEKEYSLEQKLNKDIIEKLKLIKLELLEYTAADSYIIDCIDDLQTELNEFLNSITMMKQSKYISPIKKRIEELEKKLVGIEDLLEELVKCQRSWIYLYPIFISEDLKKKMPVEKKLFDEVDSIWKAIMKQVKNDPYIFENFDWEKTKADFENANKNLDDILHSLSNYLENKREEFPRFYFLSDDELIEIISKTKDPLLVIKYLNKCFEGINTLEFSGNGLISAFISEQNEKITLVKPINVFNKDKTSNVEKWLSDLEEGMKLAIKTKALECYNDLSCEKLEWLNKWPGQLILAINSIKWTNEVELAINDGSLKTYEEKMNKDLSQVVDLVRKDIPPLLRLTLSALIVIDVHSKYVVNELIEKDISSISDFNWISQLRYAMTKKEKVKVKIMTSDYDYQYEYLGNSSRLVITPLTDRCYRTLMNAYQYFYGGAPEGPAGTGKTETVKDLAKTVAVQCIVFNCTDQINYVAMSKFFKGLSQTGSWCCFDEFNRIAPEVLSVIAVQVRTIQNAIKMIRDEKGKFFFEGKHIRLIKSASINITMNPGYAGRSELPDNLKALFRSCAMMVPNYSLIAEICLYSYGFQEANNLATKIVGALRLSSEQLSSQKHYDFGMRALKAILVAAGNLKRKNNNELEDRLCLQALKDVNLPKFTENDIVLFESIISDLFPGIKQPKKNWDELTEKMEEACFERKLIARPHFIKKSIQLYETILVRHGLMLVGETLSGKTRSLKVLRDALIKTGKNVQIRTINPKAITGHQLYGFLNPDTKVWTEGVIPQVMKECAASGDENNHKWMVFDGPVDAEWIENMNTVLDDNKVLCLTNGQKIKLTNFMTMMFEVENLFSASPATVSRCGMIYTEAKQLYWKTLIEKMIKFDLDERMSDFFKTLNYNLEWLLSAVLAYISSYCVLPLMINDMKLVDNVLTLFKILVVEYEKKHGLDNIPKNFETRLLDITLFSVIWGVGGIIDEDYRNEVNIFLLRLIYYEDVKESYKIKIDMKDWEPRGLQIKIKDNNNLYNNRFNIETLAWEDWIDPTAFDISRLKGLKFEELIIPTGDSTRNGYFVRTLLENKRHIIVTGPTGTGKTIGVMNEIDSFMLGGNNSSLCTTFSGQTVANKLQKQIEDKMTTRKGKKGIFGPEENKEKLLVYIDDLNMPTKDTYGAQAPIELLRMWLDHQFWYELDTREERYLVDMYMVSTMGPPKTGRNTLTPRFMRHYYLFYAQPFEQASMKNIFDSVMDWHFLSASPKFIPSIQSIKGNIVDATLDLFERIKGEKELLPTPKKSHYLFSLRDISRVFQTISKSTYRSFKNQEGFINLWVHECMRVFMDRLVDKNDRLIFMNLLKSVMKNNFNYDWEKVVKNPNILWTSYITTLQMDKNGVKKPLSGVYIELTDSQHTKLSFEKYLTEYNEANSQKLDLVLFDEAIAHVVKILRVMSIPNGHCLLVGLGGLGRKSLSSLSAFIADFQLKTIEMNTNFGMKEWIQSLQEILICAGVDNEKVMFQFSDNQIFREEVLEDIVSLLDQGHIPDLFPNDEKIKIIEDIAHQYREEVDHMNSKQKFEFFIDKCRENLHLSLCFSPVDVKFKQRLRSYPSFINNTTIDWFLDWPKNALNSVAERYIKADNFKPNEIKSISSIFVNMQASIQQLSCRFLDELRRHYYVTPTSYLEVLSTFKRVLESQKKEIRLNLETYKNGIQTLIESKKKVEEMKTEIVELEPKLKEATIETEKLIDRVQKEQAEADIKKKNCEAEELVCNKDKETAEELKKSCREELDKVEPLLDEASKNLKTIKRNHIDFIKQIKNPLPPIQRLFKGLCVFYKIKNIPMVKNPDDPYKKKPDYSTPARNIIMAKPDHMLNNLLSYDAEVINQVSVSIIKNLKELQKDPDYDIGSITNVSQAAGKIALFLNTVVEIYDKLQIINPKRENLRQAESDLQAAEEQLKEKRDELNELMKKIDDLQKELKTAKDKSDFLDSEISRCKRQMGAAEKLVTSLESERLSWGKNIEILKKTEEKLIGNCILASGVMAYLGIFPINYRQETLEKWIGFLKDNGINYSEDFKLRDLMTDEIVIGGWTNKHKLPNDSYSIDNAIILKNSTRFSLMIDPQNQANRWIRNMEKENNLVVLKPTSKPSIIISNITNAIEIGFPVLYENVGEEVDWTILSVFENKRKKKGKGVQFKFMDKWLDLNENFKFYTTTKISKPHYSPEICVMVTVLNFQVTPSGLEDQLLNILVAKEDPNSEKARQNNIKEFYELRAKQKVTEENILSLLCDNKDKNILDDDVLIETLQKSKQDAKDATLRLKDIDMMKKKLLNTRNFYKTAANRVSNLFFCVMDLGSIEPMYQFSLDWFIQLYRNAIDQEPKVKETRVSDVIRIFIDILFQRICPSLFEKDKLLFSLLIYIKTLECENKTNLVDLRYLFIGGTAIRADKNPLSGCISDKQWALVKEAEDKFEVFKKISLSMEEKENEWKDFLNNQTINSENIPEEIGKEMNDIEHLILQRILRPDQLIELIQNKIERELGTDFVDFPSFNLESIFPDSNNSTPIIFILSQGSEPLADIDRLANVMGKGKNVDVLSLGQGQELNAKKAIEFAQSKGRWIVLQNCHLAPKFLFEIEKLLEIESKTDFRLWLTSMPTDKFPVTLLQKGIKITNEPPRGLKANILKNYSTFNNKFLENHNKPYEWKKLLFGLTFFHSVVQERRKFSSLGWNIGYEFSQMDLTISISQLNSMLKDFDEVPWECLKYSVAEANYGGRVTDPMDRRLIKVILSKFVSIGTLEDGYKFSESGTYYSPDVGDISFYRNFIKNEFPLNDLPEVFGLHANAEITYGIKESNKLMGTLLSLLPRMSSAQGVSIDDIIMEKATHILDNLPSPFKPDDVIEKFPVVYENSMNTVLNQEIIRYNNLSNKISTTLVQLRKAIEGFVLMTSELDEVYLKILDNKVPESWNAYSYPSVKPLGSWFENFLQRIAFIRSWIENGQPATFWISGFFFTQSFLTGILQNYSRKFKVPIDTLVFEHEVLEEGIDTTQPADIGCYIHGLFIEASQWNKEKRVIVDADPKMLFSPMPYFCIKPIALKDRVEKHQYSCPVYKTSLRAGLLSTTGHSTNYVISIDLPIAGDCPEEFWIKRGVAMLCDLDD